MNENIRIKQKTSDAPVLRGVKLELYLQSTEIIDWQHPDVFKLARQLARNTNSVEETAKRCFEWVRDEIRHSHDFGLNSITCTASEVLHERTGYCYAKSHLLAALLRANDIPCGLCYQRLSLKDNGAPFCLHGLNAVYLPGYGWYRIDARGNKPGVNSQFSPPVEQLAFMITQPEEVDLPEVWSDPLPIVIEALRSYNTDNELFQNLPDIELF